MISTKVFINTIVYIMNPSAAGLPDAACGMEVPAGAEQSVGVKGTVTRRSRYLSERFHQSSLPP